MVGGERENISSFCFSAFLLFCFSAFWNIRLCRTAFSEEPEKFGQCSSLGKNLIKDDRMRKVSRLK
jgi:hypothetical protein